MPSATTAPQRRLLKFRTVNDALAEAERLAVAEREGPLVTAGTWTLGQTLGHLATWAGFALDGYPPELRPPWVVKLIGRALKNRIIHGAMRPGMRIGRVPGGTVGTELLSTEEGLGRMRRTFERLAREVPREANPVFGPMTHEEWIQLNLRHAELHLGYLSERD